MILFFCSPNNIQFLKPIAINTKTNGNINHLVYVGTNNKGAKPTIIININHSLNFLFPLKASEI